MNKNKSATKKRESHMEIYYKDRNHRDKTYAKMMKEKSHEALGKEFFGLITKGSSLVTGGFSRLK